ncbi:MAG: LuxR C-terminal-related transcriptional regulator [Chthoniobacteraceae bacterium]
MKVVLAGGIRVSPKISARSVATFSGHRAAEKETPLGQRTDREFEIFQALGRGHSTKKIAGRLHISAKTVETHRVHIKEKLGIPTAAGLIAYAAGWVASGGGIDQESPDPPSGVSDGVNRGVCQ